MPLSSKRKLLLVIVLGAVAMFNTNMLIANELFFEDDQETKRRRLKQEEREDSHFRRNLGQTFGTPEVPLEPIEVLRKLLKEPARRYIGKLYHMETWQFFLLAERLNAPEEREMVQYQK